MHLVHQAMGRLLVQNRFQQRMRKHSRTVFTAMGARTDEGDREWEAMKSSYNPQVDLPVRSIDDDGINNQLIDMDAVFARGAASASSTNYIPQQQQAVQLAKQQEKAWAAAYARAPPPPASPVARKRRRRAPMAVPSPSDLPERNYSVRSNHRIEDEFLYRNNFIPTVPLQELQDFLGEQKNMLGNGDTDRMDLLELWAGKARTTRSVQRCGGKAIKIGLAYDHDLRIMRNRELVSFTCQQARKTLRGSTGAP